MLITVSKDLLNMKITKYLLGLMFGLTLTGCMDDFDEPNVSDFTIFSKTSVGTVNTTIDELKDLYCEYSSGCTHERGSSNWEFLIPDSVDKVFEAVVVSNDGQYGALYQTVLLRSFEGESITINGQNAGHCIVLGVKNTCLYPYFQIGQKLRINLKGLYVGVYSKVPKIGFPYFSSAGNHNLGPMPFEMCATHIEKIGAPDPTCAECQPIDLSGSAEYPTMKYMHSPLFATISGSFPDADGKTILAPDALEDKGYAVDRDFKVSGGSPKMTVRTSTGNELSQIIMPIDAKGQPQEVSITGMLSYYSNWQMNFREPEDMKIVK